MTRRSHRHEHGGPGAGCEPHHRRYYNPSVYRIILFDQRGCGRSRPHAELARNTTWTFSRDVDLKFEFTGINYYDGQGFMIPKELGVSSAKDLNGATVCIQTGTTTELNLADLRERFIY